MRFTTASPGDSAPRFEPRHRWLGDLLVLPHGPSPEVSPESGSISRFNPSPTGDSSDRHAQARRLETVDSPFLLTGLPVCSVFHFNPMMPPGLSLQLTRNLAPPRFRLTIFPLWAWGSAKMPHSISLVHYSPISSEGMYET
jgi:hypothetical protein